MLEQQLRDQIGDLPPSAKLVVWVLEAEGELTQKQLMNETVLSQRTLRYALDILEDEEIVDGRPNPEDARQTLYSLSKPE